ncbi:MAG: aromatic-ring-hydroxylating dioxygenase subunit beta [Gammaproteobacteria bacterium]|nr:aromatic-ring-hydroxylating dioxygenase subunit beta [Gammaproteobacteria bacterium]MCY4255040.1 aromatic-ring-hydroxylating dioxygenase subunit beta [Gammaproteobacteria bacterium]MCY4340350.1 aromatic-ring-hydroxylating dioxygenase subunit beta [Gammaproteobacteria bacterium]
MSKRPGKKALARFVRREARLIDEKRLDEWYELFAEDALYWMPLARGQTDPHSHTSLFCEDRFLLKVRIERLKDPLSHSQQQPSFCQHVLQQPEVVERDDEAGEYALRTPFVYLETRLDEQFVLGGVAHHDLRREDGRLKIAVKRIELLNRDAALPSIQLFL